MAEIDTKNEITGKSEIVQEGKVVTHANEPLEDVISDVNADEHGITIPIQNDTVDANETETSIEIVEDINCTKNSIDNVVTAVEHEENRTGTSNQVDNSAGRENTIENTTATDPVSKVEESKIQTPNSIRKNKTNIDQSKTQSNTSSLKVEPTATLPKRDTINRSAEDSIVELVNRYPRASCINDLDFRAFKTKQLMANVAGAAIGGAKMEPIFQKITSEIKSVQTTQHQYEQFVSAIKNCYEKVLSDMVKDLDTMQSKFESRLTVLEMMLLERNDYRSHKSPNMLSLPVFLAAYIPYANSSHGGLAYLFIAGFLILVWRTKSKKNTRRTAAVNHFDTLSSTGEVQEPTSGVFEQVDPQNEHNNPINIQCELLPHEISCEESVESATPSVSHSEPTGSIIGSKNSLPIKDAQHGKFQTRERSQTDGLNTT